MQDIIIYTGRETLLDNGFKKLPESSHRMIQTCNNLPVVIKASKLQKLDVKTY